MLTCWILSTFFAVATYATPILQLPLAKHLGGNKTITPKLFAELEELARIVDIAYCVGTAGLGISKPFQCVSRCAEFESFELVKTFNTGPLLSDSCGYIALSHPPATPRIIVAFRGTYSIANTVADLSTVPQEYIPYPGEDDKTTRKATAGSWKLLNLARSADDDIPPAHPQKCDGCMVHTGFYRSWINTREAILADLTTTLEQYPDYALTFVGHSLGGAVATLASLDLKARGYDPRVTTFGEPRVGNEAFNRYIDWRFDLTSNTTVYQNSSFRRVTHADDPVPLLPLEEWGYHMHAGEIFIKKPDLSPDVADVHHCVGDEDRDCIAGSDDVEPTLASSEPTGGPDALLKWIQTQGILPGSEQPLDESGWTAEEAGIESEWWNTSRYKFWPIPARYKLWQLFFAHRDYFWRLGLCVPGGDPKDWYRKYPHFEDGDEQPEL